MCILDLPMVLVLGPSCCNDEGVGVGLKQLRRFKLLEDVAGEEEKAEEDANLEGILLGTHGEGKNLAGESDFYDSDYSFNSDSEEEDMDNDAMPRVEVDMEKKP